ncbi:MAG TPA: hypothetical protein DCP90_06920 [Clostridiales bacterium]|nr:MAG: hypothetical protein A2Y22_02200 [Clostridiales bacterium GWD2_32_59]HAN10327.1 hypothetical protein [Clostridiales bacterium]
MEEIVKIYEFKKGIKEDGYILTGEQFLKELVKFSSLKEAREVATKVLKKTFSSMIELRHDDSKKERYENERLFMTRVINNIDGLQDLIEQNKDDTIVKKMKADMSELYEMNIRMERRRERFGNVSGILNFERENEFAQGIIQNMESDFQEKVSEKYESSFKEVFDAAGLDFDVDVEKGIEKGIEEGIVIE